MSHHVSVPELPPQLDVASASPELGSVMTLLAALRALLDAWGPALLLVSESGAPVFISRRAAQIMARRDGLSIGANGLAADSIKTTRSLRAAITHTASRAHSLRARSLCLHLTVARRSVQPPWLLSIQPVAARNGLGGGTTGYAAISIVESDLHTRIDPLSAADYFLLTPRETDVAAQLAAGRNSREAARALHIGIGTVRTHLKSLFEKTGARSQTALALKLQAFAVHD